MLRNRNRNRRAGTATVEMAMVAPIIFLMVFGSIEFARMMMVRQSLTNAVREGCRSACLATTQDTLISETQIRRTLRGVIHNSSTTPDLNITFSPTFSNPQQTPESATAISVSAEIACSDVSWLPAFFTAGAKIRCTCTMTRE